MSQNVIRVSDVIEQRKVGGYQAMIVLLCGLIMFIDGFDTQAISYIVPLVAKEWHIAPKTLGPIFSSTLVGLMVGYLLLSPLSDKYGHKRVMTIASLMFGIFTVATVWAGDVTQLMAMRFLTGIGLGAAAPSAVALTGEFSPQRLRASFVLAIYCGFSLGFVVAGFVAGALLPVYGWTSLLWVGGVTPIVLTLLLMLCLPESMAYLTRYRGRSGELAKTLLKLDPRLRIDANTVFVDGAGVAKRAAISALFTKERSSGTLLLWLIFFINLALFYFMQSWLPTMLTAMKYPLDKIVLVTALPTTGGILAAFVVGPAMDRIGPYISISVLYLCGAAFLAFTASSFGASLPVLMLAVFLAGFCVSGGQKSVIAMAAVFYPTEIRSTGVGWALGIGRLGGIAGPSVVGMLIGAHWSPADVFYAAAVVILAAGVCTAIMGRIYGKRGNVPGTAAPTGAADAALK
ncbi:MFS transporter [Noviherbaspirillum pedocola]|uniref:MFS transporter n=1 Tax=Noviherbaspirillum pedocola TaxID=2801341 RepID=A0A934W840_9BURK|nr:MFS transporter [Noviherbaspirillum pedocola]MBK4738162.1 MFS transporter [Noviherbaspirillum pedocola]